MQYLRRLQALPIASKKYLNSSLQVIVTSLVAFAMRPCIVKQGEVTSLRGPKQMSRTPPKEIRVPSPSRCPNPALAMQFVIREAELKGEFSERAARRKHGKALDELYREAMKTLPSSVHSEINLLLSQRNARGHKNRLAFEEAILHLAGGPRNDVARLYSIRHSYFDGSLCRQLQAIEKELERVESLAHHASSQSVTSATAKADRVSVVKNTNTRAAKLKSRAAKLRHDLELMDLLLGQDTKSA